MTSTDQKMRLPVFYPRGIPYSRQASKCVLNPDSHVMTPEKAQALFWHHVNNVTVLDNASADVHALEPELFKLLHLVKSNDKHAELFKNLFIEVGTSFTHCDWALLYCMRELKWPEVKDVVADWCMEQSGSRPQPRLMRYINNLSRVYADTPWEDADFFFYHWNREHPSEPWPCDSLEIIESGDIPLD